MSDKTTHDDNEQEPAEAPAEQKSRGIHQVLQRTWDEALATTAGVEDELRRRFGRLIERSGLQQGSDELQRLATDLRRRLQKDREQVERRFDEAVRSAVTKVRDPVVEELAALRARAEKLGTRIERQLRLRPPSKKQGEAAEEVEVEEPGEQDPSSSSDDSSSGGCSSKGAEPGQPE